MLDCQFLTDSTLSVSKLFLRVYIILCNENRPYVAHFSDWQIDHRVRSGNNFQSKVITKESCFVIIWELKILLLYYSMMINYVRLNRNFVQFNGLFFAYRTHLCLELELKPRLKPKETNKQHFEFWKKKDLQSTRQLSGRGVYNKLLLLFR